MKDLTRLQLLTILHVRTHALQAIRAKYDETLSSGEIKDMSAEMNILAGHALTMGPDAATLCTMANEEMERARANARVACPECKGKGTIKTTGIVFNMGCPTCGGSKTVKATQQNKD